MLTAGTAYIWKPSALSSLNTGISEGTRELSPRRGCCLAYSFLLVAPFSLDYRLNSSTWVLLSAPLTLSAGLLFSYMGTEGTEQELHVQWGHMACPLFSPLWSSCVILLDFSYVWWKECFLFTSQKGAGMEFLTTHCFSQCYWSEQLFLLPSSHR